MPVEKLPYCWLEISLTPDIMRRAYHYGRYTVLGKRYPHRAVLVCLRTNTLREAMDRLRELRERGMIAPDALMQFNNGSEVIPLMTDDDWVIARLKEVQE